MIKYSEGNIYPNYTKVASFSPEALASLEVHEHPLAKITTITPAQIIDEMISITEADAQKRHGQQ